MLTFIFERGKTGAGRRGKTGGGSQEGEDWRGRLEGEDWRGWMSRSSRMACDETDKYQR